jgi:hypothetical protein
MGVGRADVRGVSRGREGGGMTVWELLALVVVTLGVVAVVYIQSRD